MLVLSLALLAADILWLTWVGRNVLDLVRDSVEQLAFPLLTLLTAASVGCGVRIGFIACKRRVQHERS